MSDAELDRIRPIALTVWTEAIQSDITATKWKADSVVLSTRAVPASDQLRKVRDKAIQALFAAYDRSTDDPQKRAMLSALGVPRWVSQTWFLQKATKFYEELTPKRTAQVLQNLGYVRQVNHQVERVLVRLAERQPAAVWDYFETRLARKSEDGDEERFEAVPFEFHGLEKVLSKDPQLAISKGLLWFAQDRELFRFRGGSLLSRAFPNRTPEFAAALPSW